MDVNVGNLNVRFKGAHFAADTIKSIFVCTFFQTVDPSEKNTLRF